MGVAVPIHADLPIQNVRLEEHSENCVMGCHGENRWERRDLAGQGVKNPRRLEHKVGGID